MIIILFCILSSFCFLSAVFGSGAHGGGGSDNTTEKSLELCGANFCVVGGGHANLERPPDNQIYLISSIYLACIIAAVIFIIILVDPLSRLVNIISYVWYLTT